jgi:Short C-terminal domain
MMRKLAVAIVLLICAVSAMADNNTGKGQGAFVIVDNALLYKDSEGSEAYPVQLKKGDAVGGFSKLLGMGSSYQFESEKERVRVLTLVEGRAQNGWMNRVELSRYFTYECGCGLAQAKCSPHVLERFHYKWDICFEEGRDKALAEMNATSAAAAASAAPAESTAARLQKLKELLDKGLITKEEYDSKRAEILKSM